MKPFDYSRAGSVAEALRAANHGVDTKFLGGGTNLIDLMRFGIEAPTHLVDVTHLPLNKIEPLPGGGFRIGALVRNSDLAADPRIAKAYPVLSQALLNGASPQLRNMATTGGNLMQRTRCSYFYDTAFPCNKRNPDSGCPAIAGFNRMHAILGQSPNCIAVHPSDMAVAMAVLNASLYIESPSGHRKLSIHDFHRLPGDTPERDTNLEPGELITAVELPPTTMKSGYLKVRDRHSFAFAIISVAATLEVRNGIIGEARFALGGVASKPWRVQEAESSLTGKAPTPEAFRAAAEIALAGAKGSGHNDFKIELAKRTIVRSLTDLAGGAA